MFIPIHDSNALKHIRGQYVTIGLIVANVVFFFLSVMGSEAEVQAAVMGYGYIPAVAFDYAGCCRPNTVSSRGRPPT